MRTILNKEDFKKGLKLAVEEIKKIKEVQTIILFGSYARRDYSLKHSDIDLLIFVDKKLENITKRIEFESNLYSKTNKINELNVHLSFVYNNFSQELSLLMYNAFTEGKILFERKKSYFNKSFLDLDVIYFIKIELKKLKSNEMFNLKRTFLESKKFKEFILNYYAGNLLIKEKGFDLFKKEISKKNLFFEIKYEFLYREGKPYDSL